jgi:membrane protein DedA with SNARE-associated domain
MRFASVALLVAVFAALPVVQGNNSNAQGDLRSRAARRFERSLARAQPLLERYGYAASVSTVVLEGMGIPSPGQTLLMASSIEAARGRMNIVLLVLLVTTAATVGNSIGYAIGRWGGRALLITLRVNTERQRGMEDFFRRHGGIAILFARFVDGLRQLNGIVAGILKMPWWTFTAYNIAGAILWTCSWGLGTYYLGRDIHSIAAFLHRHREFLFGSSLTALAMLILYLLRHRNPRAQTGTTRS